MAIEDRRRRDRAARRELITVTARGLAEREGWDAVTTRRLSTEIEYSQPVIYQHFSSMEDLVEAVALEGFAELATVLADARRDAARGEALTAVAHAYTGFAAESPALYDAMFTRSTRLRFGPGSPEPLHAAFLELRGAVATVAGARDVETLTEVVWAALHGLVTLGRQDRLRAGHAGERLDLVVDQFRSTPRPRRSPAGERPRH
ncbi:TetR/AcrR family transcriptional regulator [Jatrophihabitans sp. YIM 134969]